MIELNPYLLNRGKEMNILVCDDDCTSCEYISDFIKSNYTHNVITSYDADSCLKATNNSDIDLLIIDIDLGDENGIDVANNIYINNPSIKVIFITAYGKKYYDNIYDGLKPQGYIDKPLQENILKFFIKQVEDDITNNKETFSFSYDKKAFIIPQKSIYYFQSDRRLCLITTDQNTYRFYSKLSDLESKLSENFLRCHHSYIVNSNHIYSVHKREITLTNGETIPMSNKYSHSVLSWKNKVVINKK